MSTSGEPRRWRLARSERSKGTYWQLQTGRNESRSTFSLGYVTEKQAETALETMQDEEKESFDTPKYGRVERRIESDPESTIQLLISGGDLDEAFGPEPVNYKALTLREYYLKQFAPAREIKRPKSWRTEAGHWARVLQSLGSVRVVDLDAHLVADYLDGLRVGKRGGDPKKQRANPDRAASGATKRLHRAALQALLNFAHRQKHIDEHRDLAVFKIEGSTKRVREKAPPLNLDELVKLMDASEPKHRAMWAVGAGQGLRPSELRRMRWDDVRWASRTLMVRGDEDGEGKTALSVAEIPMTPLAYRELNEWWVEEDEPTEGVVFPVDEHAVEPTAYESVAAYKRALATAAKKAGIGHPVNPYLLRDSFATIAWSLGIEMDVARRILRHADETMLREVYCRPRPADLVAKVAAFDVGPKRVKAGTGE